MLRSGVLRVTTPVEAEPRLREARVGDREAVEALLASLDLPTVELDRWLDRFVVVEASDGAQRRLVGVAGLEVHGRDGVLRSVAVAPTFRGRGLGSLLTEAVIERAEAEGLRRLYLLTTTAEAYFPRQGFRRVERDEVSGPVAASVEFAEACPASAVAMVLELEPGS